MILSINFNFNISLEVNFSASAAISLCSQLLHRIEEQDSGEITEYHVFSNIKTLSPTPIPNAPPEAQLVNNPNYRVVALTNWSAETFPVALKRFDFLHWFEGIVVSGAEQTRKPFLEIYQTTLDRFQLKAESSLFIDDNVRNVEAAKKLGIQTVHFSNPHQLRNELTEKNVLI